MTILLPALLVSFGRWLFWPWVPRYGAPRPARSLWAWVARWIAQRPRAVWLATAAALMVCAAASSGVRTGLAGNATYTTAPESVVGQRLLAAHFPGGASAPSEVVARASSAPAVLAAVAATRGSPERCPPPTWAASCTYASCSPNPLTALQPSAPSSAPQCTTCPGQPHWSAVTRQRGWTQRMRPGTTATIVVRALLVPVLALDAGRFIWWPSRIAREIRPGLSESPARRYAGQSGRGVSP